jgi:RNA polymerase sigma factor (sigma-70 family)
MMTAKIMPVAVNNDAELVSGTLAGNRDAFSQIVSRYQSLICSLAYSATGSLGQSEDLAQETFITAWKHLSHLRERDKLRAWLCGIARNRINNFLRREGREPNHKAESIEDISETHSPEPLPVEHTITKEEQAILWRSLERIPEIYREPLVLFYREHQSVEAVAEKLELTEDAVKQRLSRGRKLLHEQVLAFVEGALAKTSPGKHFTLGVIAALPLASTSAKAATVGGVLAKAGGAMKGSAILGFFGSVVAPLGALYFTLRAEADDTKSPREREFMRRMIGFQIVLFVIPLVMYFGLGRFFPDPRIGNDIALAALFFSIIARGVIWTNSIYRRQQQIQMEDGTYDAAEWIKPRMETDPLSVQTRDQSKLKKFLLALRVIIFPVVLALAILHWKHTPDQNTHYEPLYLQLLQKYIWLAIFVVPFGYMAFRSRQKLPRFVPALNPRYRFGLVIAMGLITLVCFNIQQYTLPAANAAGTTTIIIFNSVVFLAYAALVGILVWKRKAATSSTPQN